MASVSLCMIVRNEEANLGDCLAGAAGLFAEIVIADTGSRDGTRALAEKLGARVFDFPWQDNFAAARNATLDQARGDWVFWLDADDRLDEQARDRLRALFGPLRDEPAAYAMRCRCTATPGQPATVVDHVRLFRNDPRLRWRYRVHEQILPALRRASHEVRRAEVVIHHTGYEDANTRRRKLQRDLRLLQMEQPELPDDPYVLFNLGAAYRLLDRHDEALHPLQRSLERSRPSDSITPKLYALITSCHQHLGRLELALAVCQSGRMLFAADAELLFAQGRLLAALGRVSEAERCFEALLHGREEPRFGSAEEGLRSFQARHQLALLCRAARRPADAELHWRESVREWPGFLLGWLGLAELALDCGDLRQLDALIAQVAELPGGDREAEMLRARGWMATGRFADAIARLAELRRRWPDEIQPLVLLSHALLKQDRDHDQAERVLREILSRRPDDVEARHNLALLLRKEAHDSVLGPGRTKTPPR